MGHPWWSSSGCALPVQGAQVLPPVGELRSHRLHLAANKKKGVDITGIISKKQNLKQICCLDNTAASMRFLILKTVVVVQSLSRAQLFSFSISLSKEHSELISFRADWLDLHTPQETLKSLLQHNYSKHQFFGAQPSLWSNSHICT